MCKASRLQPMEQLYQWHMPCQSVSCSDTFVTWSPRMSCWWCSWTLAIVLTSLQSILRPFRVVPFSNTGYMRLCRTFARQQPHRTICIIIMLFGMPDVDLLPTGLPCPPPIVFLSPHTYSNYQLQVYRTCHLPLCLAFQVLPPYPSLAMVLATTLMVLLKRDLASVGTR